MGFEVIIGGFIAAIVAIFGALTYGKRKGRADAITEKRIEQSAIDAKRAVESSEKATQAQLKVSNDASKIRDEVSKLPSGDALSELRRDFTRD